VVERQLPKLNVVGSIPIARSIGPPHHRTTVILVPLDLVIAADQDLLTIEA
jgi:hypothetical protein